MALCLQEPIDDPQPLTHTPTATMPHLDVAGEPEVMKIQSDEETDMAIALLIDDAVSALVTSEASPVDATLNATGAAGASGLSYGINRSQVQIGSYY